MSTPSSECLTCCHWTRYPELIAHGHCAYFHHTLRYIFGDIPERPDSLPNHLLLLTHSADTCFHYEEKERDAL